MPDWLQYDCGFDAVIIIYIDCIRSLIDEERFKLFNAVYMQQSGNK